MGGRGSGHATSSNPKQSLSQDHHGATISGEGIIESAEVLGVEDLQLGQGRSAEPACSGPLLLMCCNQA